MVTPNLINSKKISEFELKSLYTPAFYLGRVIDPNFKPTAAELKIKDLGLEIFVSNTSDYFAKDEIVKINNEDLKIIVDIQKLYKSIKEKGKEIYDIHSTYTAYILANRTLSRYGQFTLSKIRRTFNKSIADALQAVSNLGCFNASSILEIGSGPLMENSSGSFLTSHLPASICSKITHSDCNYATVCGAIFDKKNVNYIHFDVLQAAELPKSKYDVIIECAVFDMFPLKNLMECLLNIKKVLNDNGKIVHICDIQPSLNAFISTYVHKDLVLFPLLDRQGCFIGLHILDLKSYNQIQRSNLKGVMKKDEFNFLEWYIELPATLREMLLIHIASEHQNFLEFLSNLASGYLLDMCIEANLIDEFDQRLSFAFQKVGYSVELNKMVSGMSIEGTPESKDTNRNTHTEFNLFENDMGLVTEKVCRLVNLPIGKTMHISNLHLLIAKKTGSKE
jgi:hypothetical protein